MTPVTNINSNYQLRKPLVRGIQCIDAFGTSWRVADRQPDGFKIEHVNGGWLFGIGNGGIQTAVRAVTDNLNNQIAQEGCDRCWCGCKYWENDHCIDCNTHILEVRNAATAANES